MSPFIENRYISANTKSQVIETLKDWRVWLVCICTMLSSIPNGGLSNFSSILLTTFGYTSQQALVLTAPQGAIGVIMVLLVGYLSDKLNDRSSYATPPYSSYSRLANLIQA
jgi:MFS transporter, ACS family, allantoate permease